MGNSLFINFYRPFRNKLRNVNPYTGFYVIWSYLENILQTKDIAPDIQVRSDFSTAEYYDQVRVISPWELESIAREILINSNEHLSETYGLNIWNNLIKVVNKLKELNNELTKIYGGKSTIHIELNRISHQQFPWTVERPSRKTMIRYYKVYNNEKLKTTIEEYFGFDLKKMYVISGALYGTFLQKYSAKYSNLKSELPGISDEDINQYITIFSKDFAFLKETASKNFRLDETFPYLFNPLRDYPLVKIKFRTEDFLCCPITYYFVWKFTSGIYFNLYGQNHFNQNIGDSFQSYVGEILEETNKDKRFKIYPERQYYLGTNRKDQVDWLIEDRNSLLFIECKCKRPNLSMKVNLKESEIESELKKIAGMVFQIYKTIQDWKKNLYINYKYDKNKKIFPILVTFEEWYIWGDLSNKIIREELTSLFKANNMDISIVEEMPFTITSINNFELLMQIINQKSSEEILSLRNLNEKNQLMPLDQFIRLYFGDELKFTEDLFKSTFREIFSLPEKI